MWHNRLRLAQSVADDWAALNSDERALVMKTLEIIDEDPIVGTPLFEPLRGLWSHRIGGLRILYRIVAEARYVLILAIVRIEERPLR
ncbi:MAG TPA: type II toxin-antitoxin system RelE/ParE family toxin [Thermoanaerobaculia bacterium]